MAGARKKDDQFNSNGSGFHAGDPVTVDYLGEEETVGNIEAVHADGKKVDVRICHPGHKDNGRVVTFPTDDVESDDPKPSKASAKAAE